MDMKTLYDSCQDSREELAYFMRRLYAQNLTTCSGGNLSMRIDEDHVLITPSALDKGRISADQIGLLTIDGENLTPELKASIETQMHLLVYKTRPDVKAVVHAHPVMATSFSAMTVDIDTTLTAEAYAVLGIPGKAPYALMGTQGLAERVALVIKNKNIAIMENHGIITVGPTILKAFDRLEVLEAAAKMTIITSLMQRVSPISKEGIAELDAWMASKTPK